LFSDRSGRERNGGFVGATGRQRYQHLGSVHRTRRQAILREALPNLGRLAIIGDVGYAGSVLEISEELRTKYS
jgi:hypothetical protein